MTQLDNGKAEEGLEVAERACSPFLKQKPEAHFLRAELLEMVGREDEARDAYKLVLDEVKS